MVIIRGRKWEKMGSCPRNMAFQLDKRVRVERSIIQYLQLLIDGL